MGCINTKVWGGPRLAYPKSSKPFDQDLVLNPMVTSGTPFQETSNKHTSNPLLSMIHPELAHSNPTNHQKFMDEIPINHINHHLHAYFCSWLHGHHIYRLVPPH